MGRTPGRRRLLAPLLILLVLSVSVAAPTPLERALRDVRTAADRGQWKDVEALSSDALRRFGSLDDDAVWEIRVWRAKALVVSGKKSEALQILGTGLPKRMANSAIAVQRLMILGYATGDKSYLDAAEQLAKVHQPFWLSEVLLVRSFNAKNPEVLLKEALRLAKKHKNEASELRIANRLNHYLIEKGRMVEGIRGEYQLIERARARHDESTEHKTEGELGWALREIGELDEAAEYFARAERFAATSGAINDRIPWLIQLGNVAYARHDFAAAERHYREAQRLGVEQNHDQLAKAVANLATIAIETGRYDEARRLNAQALAMKMALKQVDAVLRSKLIDARIAVASGDYATARQLAESAAQETKVPATRWLAQAQLANISAKQKQNDEADKQFRRAMSTLRDARAAIDDEELRLSFNTLSQEVLDDYLAFLVDNGHAEEALLVSESVRGQTLEEGLGIANNDIKLDPRAIARNVGASILCYNLRPQRSYVWSITPDAVTVAPLPPSGTIRAAIDAYVRDLLGPIGKCDMRGTALYRMLVEPAKIRSGRVVIIADDRLNVLNLETLVVPGPTPRFWIEDVVLRTAPSLQILARTARAAAAPKSVLLIGNAPQADAAYPALPRAGVEVERVRNRFARAVTLTGAKATPAAYRAASPQSFDVVHFVAHGEATLRSPLDSAVILAPDKNGYKLFARDIVQQPINARLVTVSSCYGAGKRTYVGEGLVGLAWAFLRAGAQQVVAALWDVSDAATPELMDAMYARMRGGADTATALREAKLTLVRSKGVYARPRFWAPFVLYSGM